MCGIVGIIGTESVTQRILAALKRLEYRGYDSAGLATVEKSLNGRGRVLVRYSGTESIFRIMLEGPEQDMIERMAGNIADSARLNLG